MSNASLSLGAGTYRLSVRSFAITKRLSNLFEAHLEAVSPTPDIDLEAVVGDPAELSLDMGLRGTTAQQQRVTGIIRSVEQIRVEERGVSTYALCLVPDVWLLTQRTNHRVFQHLAAPEIATKILGEWGITPRLEIDPGAFRRFEYRIQYGETDYAFLSRMLEDAGITTYYAAGEGGRSVLVLADQPDKGAQRAPIRFTDSPTPESREEYVTRVAVSRRLRAGAFTVRDHDFQRRASDVLESAKKTEGAAEAGKADETRLEQYLFEPGAFLVEATTAADTAGVRGAATHDEKEAEGVAKRAFDAERCRATTVRFATNAIPLSPGDIVRIADHAHPSLARPLLVTSVELTGHHDAPWGSEVEAVFADLPYRPQRKTARPRVRGVQSAFVVGPGGDEIHVDTYGRIRVQFPWDREGGSDDSSSCWIRVSQAWAGSAYGMVALPRIGQEVLVSFLDGNADLPVVVGRVHNTVSPVPYALPEHKTRTVWRSQSTPQSAPGAGGYNEIFFEDKAGTELVGIRAERNMTTLVQHDEVGTTARDRTSSIGRNRSVTVGGGDTTWVGERHEVSIRPSGGGTPTTLTMQDRHIVYSTGQASMTIDGADLRLEAEGNITIVSKSGDVIVRGGPNVKINC